MCNLNYYSANSEMPVWGIRVGCSNDSVSSEYLTTNFMIFGAGCKPSCQHSVLDRFANFFGAQISLDLVLSEFGT
jgi:hypothetical protein